MPSLDELVRANPYAEKYLIDVHALLYDTSRILIVVDGGISIAAINDFGLSKVIKILRSTSLGWSDFTVTLATRDGVANKNAAAATEQFTYSGFRFDRTEADGSLSIGHFDQIWCFGLWPGNGIPNNPNSLDPALDAIANNAAFNPTSVNELEKLTRWMDAGGGLFATGDHHLLGAPMCKDIPRANTMRRWTIADGVPTTGLTTRRDTNQPGNAAERAHTEVIEFGRQSDDVPQPIEWVPEYSSSGRFSRWDAPHPILCHPTHGPINVFPDHPHEGICFDPADPGWIATHRDATYNFNGYAGDQYPTVGGHRPLPKVIAWGNTVPSPPFLEEKGSQPARRFPLVTVYDGQIVGHGRVVTDSTWHHWFDINLGGLEASADQVPIDKIRRYYQNVAIWLATPHWRRHMFVSTLEWFRFSYTAKQELVLAADVVDVGRLVIDWTRYLGPCWVRSFIWDVVLELEPKLFYLIEDVVPQFPPKPDPCLVCVPLELTEAAVMGGIAQRYFANQERLDRELAAAGAIETVPSRKSIDESIVEGARDGLRHLLSEYRRSMERTESRLAPLSEAIGPAKGGREKAKAD